MSAAKKKWQVTIPITGIACATVEADSEEEAIEKAMESGLKIEEWEAHRVVCRGNVYYGMLNRADAQEVE